MGGREQGLDEEVVSNWQSSSCHVGGCHVEDPARAMGDIGNKVTPLEIYQSVILGLVIPRL